MKQAIRSLTLFGLFALAAGCDSAPAADDKAKMADKTLASAAPPAPASDVAGKSADAVAVKPAGDDRGSPAAPAVTARPGDDDRTAAVATRTPDRAKEAAKPADSKATDSKPVDSKATDDKVAAAADAGDGGGSLVEREGWANYAKDLKTKISAVNNSCGSSLSASYDKSTYTNFDPMQDRTQGACEAAVGTLQAICATEEGKAAVQKLTRTVCKFSTTGTGIQKSGTTLVVKIDPAKSSITGKAAGSYSWASAIKEVL